MYISFSILQAEDEALSFSNQEINYHPISTNWGIKQKELVMPRSKMEQSTELTSNGLMTTGRTDRRKLYTTR